MLVCNPKSLVSIKPSDNHNKPDGGRSRRRFKGAENERSMYLVFEVNFNGQDEACVSRLLHFVRWILAHWKQTEREGRCSERSLTFDTRWRNTTGTSNVKKQKTGPQKQPLIQNTLRNVRSSSWWILFPADDEVNASSFAPVGFSKTNKLHAQVLVPGGVFLSAAVPGGCSTKSSN